MSLSFLFKDTVQLTERYIYLYIITINQRFQTRKEVSNTAGELLSQNVTFTSGKPFNDQHIS